MTWRFPTRWWRRAERPLDWATVRKTWAWSRRVDHGPVGPAAIRTRGYAVFFRVLTERSISIEALREGLADPSPVVVGYCLFALYYFGDPLDALPPGLPSRTEQIREQCGCVGSRRALGELATTVQGWAKDRAAGRN